MLTVSTSDEDKNYHHGSLRAALIDAALALLAEGGVDELSLRAVARKAGVSAMAPYRHYPDKESLLAAVALRGFDGLRAVLLEADQNAAPGKALEEQSVAYVRYALDNPALFRLMFGPAKYAKHPDLKAKGDSAYAVLASRITAETPDPAKREARALGCWSLVHGLSVLLLDGRLGPALSTEALVRQVTTTMLASGV